MHAFGAVAPPWWSDRPVFLLGGGASLRGFDFARLRGRGIAVGINQAMFDADVAAGISIDHPFVRNREGALCTFAARRELYLAVGERWRDAGLPAIAGAVYLRGIDLGVSLQADCVATGGTSGHAALNLAVLKRARRIVLLGYDYGPIGEQHHYHDAYPWHRPAEQSWRAWAKRFEPAAAALATLGIAVVNASPHSRLACFPRMSIDEALAWAQS